MPPIAAPRRLLAVAAAAMLATLVAGGASGAPSTYYVDCSAGNDGSSGRSAALAWRTLDKANTANLVAGDRLLLKRGCVWTGPLKARWTGTARSPITIGAYGSGDLPRIQNAHENVAITGSYLVTADIWTRSAVPARDRACENQPLGYRIGFRFMPGSAHDTVRDSRADEQYIGILVEAGAHNNSILNNTLRGNNMRDPNRASGAGSVGIGLMGDDNDVGYNDIS